MSARCHSKLLSAALWILSLLLALREQRQTDFCEFEASLIYRVSSRMARVAQRNCLEKKNPKPKAKRKTTQ